MPKQIMHGFGFDILIRVKGCLVKDQGAYFFGKIRFSVIVYIFQCFQTNSRRRVMDEAFEIGLVSKVVPQENLASEGEALAQAIADKAPIALRYIKEAVNKGMDLTLEQGLRLEGDLYFLLHTTADRTEGIKAFLQKRPPRFKGQ